MNIYTSIKQVFSELFFFLRFFLPPSNFAQKCRFGCIFFLVDFFLYVFVICNVMTFCGIVKIHQNMSVNEST